MRMDRLHARLLRGAVLVAAGLGCAGAGAVLFPDSNLGGGFGVVGGLLVGVGVLVALIAVAAWIVDLRLDR